MDGRSLLQGLLLLVTLGASLAQMPNFQSNPSNPQNPVPVLFPGNTEAVSRNDQTPHSLPIRVSQRPQCSQQIVDASAPCEEDVDYNDNVRRLVESFLRQSNSINGLVRDPNLRLILNDTLTPVSTAISPATRFGGPRETPVCHSVEELIFPKRAKTPRDEWVFIANQDSVKQALRVERCISEDKPCNIDIAASRDITTVCRQKYVYRRMLAVGDNSLMPEEVLMPSCCVCYTRKNNFDIGTRIGNGNETDQESRTTDGMGSPAPTGSAINFNQGNQGRSPPGNSPRASSVQRREMVVPHQNQPQNFWNPNPNQYPPYFMGGRR